MSSAKAIIFGCEGLVLKEEEKAFFKANQPLGFILFARNIQFPAQVKKLVNDLRACVDHQPVPILIDQEGGRIFRLSAKHWRVPPEGALFGEIYKTCPKDARRAMYLNYRLIAQDLYELGIDVDCAPILDTRVQGADLIVGDRAFSTHPEIVADLGQEAIQGLHDGGVLSVIKHMPTHGPADVDSHKALPTIEWSLKELKPHFAPFQANASAPWGMTAHIVYTAIDPTQPGTYSSKVITDIIRGEIGFEGFLLSDDLCMEALKGPLDQRAHKALAAGCDAVIHWNGKMEEMVEIIEGVSPLRQESYERVIRGYTQLDRQFFDMAALSQELDQFIQIRKAS